MKLHFRKNGLLSDVQKEFNAGFPYLKIEFFRYSQTDKNLSPKKEKMDPFTSPEGLVKWDRDLAIEVHAKMKVSEFETMMEEYGLYVQVFRKSGRVWIEAPLMDDWTLDRQNEEGKMMSSIHDVFSGKQIDWDE